MKRTLRILLMIGAAATIAAAASPAMAGGIACMPKLPKSVPYGPNRQQFDSKGISGVTSGATMAICAATAAVAGPGAALDNCGCKVAVKRYCSFDWNDGDPIVSAADGAKIAWCAPFAPWNL